MCFICRQIRYKNNLKLTKKIGGKNPDTDISKLKISSPQSGSRPLKHTSIYFLWVVLYFEVCTFSY